MRFVSLVALLALSAPAIAQEAPAAASKPKEEKKICRMVDATGSILGGKRVCHTKAEWAQIAEQARLQRESRSNNNGSLGMGGRDM